MVKFAVCVEQQEVAAPPFCLDRAPANESEDARVSAWERRLDSRFLAVWASCRRRHHQVQDHFAMPPQCKSSPSLVSLSFALRTREP
ncbi:hypothetical protein E4U54_004361 [Claviceps lovelessii]|nr:hypothetical protein E4U54_004361 [Claviceps lovelessii]